MNSTQEKKLKRRSRSTSPATGPTRATTTFPTDAARSGKMPVSKRLFDWQGGLWNVWEAKTPIGIARVERKDDGLFHCSFNGKRSKKGDPTAEAAKIKCEFHMLREAREFLKSLDNLPVPQTSG